PPPPLPIPSHQPPARPQEPPLPLGPTETPPPPPTPPASPLPTLGPLPTTPPPLAPIATPDPRPSTGEQDVPGKSTDPADAGDDPARDPDGTRQLIDVTGGGTGEPPDPEAGAPNALERSFAQLARTAGEAVQRFAFPLSLTVLVLVFLLIQGEIDRRDPKLAFAPVDSSKDMVYFQ
ncbi:MAG: hypothetical protein M3323_05060, partial [Actinomycetota bacterium]|nr:hypothetical protein [Actinomycetota bacterium]